MISNILEKSLHVISSRVFLIGFLLAEDGPFRGWLFALPQFVNESDLPYLTDVYEFSGIFLVIVLKQINI